MRWGPEISVVYRLDYRVQSVQAAILARPVRTEDTERRLSGHLLLSSSPAAAQLTRGSLAWPAVSVAGRLQPGEVRQLSDRAALSSLAVLGSRALLLH